MTEPKTIGGPVPHDLKLAHEEWLAMAQIVTNLNAACAEAMKLTMFLNGRLANGLPPKQDAPEKPKEGAV